jgi:hypothetical protein
MEIHPMVNRPPNLLEGVLLFALGYAIFKLTFDFVFHQLRHSKFLQKFHRTLCKDNLKVTHILDDKSLFELSNWVVSSLQV